MVIPETSLKRFKFVLKDELLRVLIDTRIRVILAFQALHLPVSFKNTIRVLAPKSLYVINMVHLLPIHSLRCTWSELKGLGRLIERVMDPLLRITFTSFHGVFMN